MSAPSLPDTSALTIHDTDKSVDYENPSTPTARQALNPYNHSLPGLDTGASAPWVDFESVEQLAFDNHLACSQRSSGMNGSSSQSRSANQYRSPMPVRPSSSRPTLASSSVASAAASAAALAASAMASQQSPASYSMSLSKNKRKADDTAQSPATMFRQSIEVPTIDHWTPEQVATLHVQAVMYVLDVARCFGPDVSTESPQVKSYVHSELIKLCFGSQSLARKLTARFADSASAQDLLYGAARANLLLKRSQGRMQQQLQAPVQPQQGLVTPSPPKLRRSSPMSETRSLASHTSNESSAEDYGLSHIHLHRLLNGDLALLPLILGERSAMSSMSMLELVHAYERLAAVSGARSCSTLEAAIHAHVLELFQMHSDHGEQLTLQVDAKVRMLITADQAAPSLAMFARHYHEAVQSCRKTSPQRGTLSQLVSNT